MLKDQYVVAIMAAANPLAIGASLTSEPGSFVEIYIRIALTTVNTERTSNLHHC